MRLFLVLLGLFAFSLTTNSAFAGSCGGGDHTHSSDSSDSSDKKKKGSEI